ncbi:hypothetical protein UlMin_006750 [Ulmus minor]
MWAKIALVCSLLLSRNLVGKTNNWRGYATTIAPYTLKPIFQFQHKKKNVKLELGARKTFTSHSHVNDAGSIDSPLMTSMENKIKEQLNAHSVIVMDAYGDGRHVSIDVVSLEFEGKSAVNKQRMVYKAILEEL